MSTLLPHPTAADWLIQNWRLLVREPFAESALVAVALFCGALVGEERQKSEKPAGLRTLILVCLGSTIFTLVSFAFGTPDSAGRIAAQIVTGIGFLGGGVILRTAGGVSGITTAATIWAMAGIGMVVGVGYAGGAICLAVLVRFLLGSIAFFENRLAGDLEQRSVDIDFDPVSGKTAPRLERILSQHRRESIGARWSQPGGDTMRLSLRLLLPRHALCELLDTIAGIPEVRAIRQIENKP